MSAIHSHTEFMDAPATLNIQTCGPEAAEDIHALTQEAYAPYASLTPPSDALDETLQVVRSELRSVGGFIATVDGVPVAAGRFGGEDLVDTEDAHSLEVERLCVRPDQQGLGIGTAVMEWVHEHAAEHGYREVRLGVRTDLPRNRSFYRRLGYVESRLHHQPNGTNWWEMHRQIAAHTL